MPKYFVKQNNGTLKERIINGTLKKQIVKNRRNKNTQFSKPRTRENTRKQNTKPRENTRTEKQLKSTIDNYKVMIKQLEERIESNIKLMKDYNAEIDKLSNVIDSDRLKNLKRMQNEIIIKQNDEYKQTIEQLHINIKTSEELLVQLTKIETTKIALGIKI
jgi:predicted RNase H-like nuclease (RuvC/YqgF family)